jgi:hypothetical protein
MHNLKMRLSLLAVPAALLIAAYGGAFGKIIGFHWR